LRTEDLDGVWQSAKANMELYLTLRERSQTFRADKRVQEALEAAGVADLSRPTLDDGETHHQLASDRSAFEIGGDNFGDVAARRLAPARSFCYWPQKAHEARATRLRLGNAGGV
jgi:hypothetical protein